MIKGDNMKEVYVGNRFRMLCVLSYLKVRWNAHSYCSLREYATTLKSNRTYKLVDDGYCVHINRV